jgi:hypothetical protein
VLDHGHSTKHSYIATVSPFFLTLFSRAAAAPSPAAPLPSAATLPTAAPLHLARRCALAGAHPPRLALARPPRLRLARPPRPCTSPVAAPSLAPDHRARAPRPRPTARVLHALSRRAPSTPRLDRRRASAAAAPTPPRPRPSPAPRRLARDQSFKVIYMK